MATSSLLIRMPPIQRWCMFQKAFIFREQLRICPSADESIRKLSVMVTLPPRRWYLHQLVQQGLPLMRWALGATRLPYLQRSHIW